MNMSGQTINDRLLAARHSIAGQGLAKSVCKSTTEEVIGPKKKHLDYLIHCTNEPNVSIPQLANLLIERTQNTSWVVVFKALITVHHLMCYGNERFTQYLASSNCTFQLSNFLDKSGVAGYDMSTFIRRYAKYLNEKALSYRTVAFDFCKVKRGKEDGTLRTMTAEKLLKTLPVLQNQLDALLEFDCTANELTNGVINTTFMLLFRDLIRLFACYNDGIINLLEKYFDMNKKQCREALDVYKKFLIRMDKVAEFLKVAENVGIDKGEIPDLTKAPSSLLDALEQHLGSLEGKKVTSTNQTRANIKSAVTAFSTTSNAFGNVVSASSEVNGAIDEGFKQRVLAEEEAMMNQMKNLKTNPSTNPFLSSPGNSPEQVAAAKAIDLFSTNAPLGAGEKLSDDLLQLGNPFADLLSGMETSASNNTLWGNQNGTAVVGQSQGFASDTNFAAVFGGTNQTVLNTGSQLVQESNSFPPGSLSSASDSIFSISDTHNVNPMPSFDVLANLSTSLQSSQPAGAPGHLDSTLSTGGPGSGMFGSSNSSTQGFDAFGDVLQPLSSGQATPKSEDTMNTLMMQESKIITSDLDSSLASLTQNLNLAPAGQKTAIQWGSPKTSAKPGMTNWNPQPMQAIGTANYRPMGSGSVKCNDWAGGMNVGIMSPPVFNSISNPIQPVWGPTQLSQQPGLMGGPVTTGVPQATSNTLFDPFDNL